AALQVSGEREITIPPLKQPVVSNAWPAGSDLRARVEECESVRLFAERAHAVKGDFALTNTTAFAVGEICLRLDGLPLAIELAAARMRLLDAPAVLERLKHRLPFLTGGARDVPARQQTLHNTIAWSCDLLEPSEQAFFRT